MEGKRPPLFAARRFEGRWVVPYVVSQCLGAMLASVTLRLMFPTHAALGATVPVGAAWAPRADALAGVLTPWAA